jgi:predicted GNAT family acetyltransferase
LRSNVVVEETRDTDLLAAFFCADPALYVYQLGDLDPFFFPATRWWITRRDQVTSALLLYSAFETAIIQAITDNEDQGRLWEALLPELPDRAHALYLGRHESIIGQRYHVRHLGAHQRMQWNRHAASAGVDRGVGIPVRVLTNDDRREIREFQDAASPDARFDERTLILGRATGAFAGKQLVAIATCHVYSRQYSVAAIGAVATHPDYRGRGYGTAVTKALVDLLADDVETIGLNVHCDNATAIRIYERLGFQRRHNYEEAQITVG